MDDTRLLARLAAEPDRAGLLLDVDGTLAPIVARPEDASVPGETQAELERLRGRYALVACISGRPAGDARRVVGVEGLVYVGEHGLELDPAAGRWEHDLDELVASAAWPAERKPLSVSFHYRTAADEERARAELERIAERAAAAGLRPRWGRKVLEVRPPVEADKSLAVQTLLGERGLRRALYAGDDVTDLDAFRGLDGLEVAVRVAVVSEEGPAELAAAADIVVESPEALLAILRRL